MAITVNVQENPLVSRIGKRVADATIINSGFDSGLVRYEIRHRSTLETMRFRSDMDISTYPQIVSISSASLEVKLPGRQHFEVRVWNDDEWSDWVGFKSRDKTYWTPVATFNSGAAFDENPTEKGNKTIVVEAVGKSEVSQDGTHVVNSDFGYNGTTEITYTAQGATVVTDNFESQE